MFPFVVIIMVKVVTLLKGSGCGGDFNGPTIKQIIHSETKLNDILVSVTGSEPFVKTLRSMARLHTMVPARHL